MKLKMTKKLMLVAAVALLSGSMVVYGLTAVLTQTFPGQTFNTASLIQGSQCTSSTLTLDSVGSVIPSFAGSPADLFFDCNNTGPAFTAQGTSTVTVTPTFTLPTGWTLALTTPIYPLTSAPCPSSNTLTSGTPIILSGGTSYAYCLSSSSATTFTSFSITWSQ